MQHFPQPTTARQLREFLGLINFYHRFIPQCAHVLQPLNTMLASTRSSQRLVWTAETTAAYIRAKEALADATLLNHPKPSAPTCIVTDACWSCPPTTHQRHMESNLLLSKKLKQAETRYNTFDRELLAIYLAIKHFRHFVEGCDFHVLTDHKPLTYTMGTCSNRHSLRQTRQLDFISSDIRYVKGSENVVADSLSRIAVNATIDFHALALAQQNNPALSHLQSGATSIIFQSVPLPAADVTLICDMSCAHPRPYVPETECL